MADEDIELPGRGYNTEDVRAQREPGEPPKRKRRWGLWLLLIFVIVPVLLLSLWTAITLAYTYSSGERAGYVQKLSKKGWLCKTWEGEIAMATLPGTMPEVFAFSVRDDAVAERINQSMGSRVSLHYEEHRGIPTSCFGETDYFVTDVRVVEGLPGSPANAPAGTLPSSGTPAPGTTPVAPPPATTPPATPPRP